MAPSSHASRSSAISEASACCRVTHASHSRLASVTHVSHGRLASVTHVSHSRLSSVTHVSHSRLASVTRVSHGRLASVTHVSHSRLQINREGAQMRTIRAPDDKGTGLYGMLAGPKGREVGESGELDTG
eukprot:9283776-Pyramimonas_sp.AAC.1